MKEENDGYISDYDADTVSRLELALSNVIQNTHGQVSKASENISKALFIVNAGGAVSVLTYLGNANSLISNINWVLNFFIYGTIATFFFYIQEYLRLLKIYNLRCKNTGNFLGKKITHAEFMKYEDNSTRLGMMVFILPTVSFIFILLALFTGFYSINY